MEHATRRSISTLAFFFLFLLLASEMGSLMVEARHCESQSHKHKGMCLSEHNCANICSTEGFTGGACKTRGIHRRCFCRKAC